MHLFLYILTLVITPATASVRKKVVVIGAGMSGLTAARTLIDNFPEFEVTVLEARDRSGGRIWTAETPAPAWEGVSRTALDMGASWILGSSSSHPITKLRSALGLVTARTVDSKYATHYCIGNDNCTEVKNYRHWAYKQLIRAAQLQVDDLGEDCSLWDALEGLSGGGLSRGSPLFQYYLANSAEFDYGASATKLSSRWFDHNSEFEGEHHLILDGYQTLTDALVEGKVRLSSGDPSLEITSAATPVPINITYDARVDKILWSNSGVRLGIAGYDDYMIADYVIVTLPLGVLKARSVDFAPPLPTPTQQTIDRLGFGNLCKLSLKFTSAWWPTGRHYYGLAQVGEKKRGLFTYMLDLQTVADSPVLTMFGTGAAAHECESMDEDALWSTARTVLVKIFGSEIVPDDAPAMQVSAWGKDPFARGAYTYTAVGSGPWDYTHFETSPMQGRVFFAGEHTTAEYPGTAHGALLSGQRAARAVAWSAGDGWGDGWGDG